MTTTAQTASRPWSPSNRDTLIYRWVKFEGYKQMEVASMLRIHQSTVSRVLRPSSLATNPSPQASCSYIGS